MVIPPGTLPITAVAVSRRGEPSQVVWSQVLKTPIIETKSAKSGSGRLVDRGRPRSFALASLQDRCAARLCENTVESLFQGSMAPWHMRKNAT